MTKAALPSSVRTALRRMLRSHPTIRDHVRNPSDVNSLSKDRLLALAEALSIDLDELARSSALADSFPFRGRLILPLAFGILGQSIERKLRITLSYRPPWSHYDPVRKAVMPGDAPEWAMEAELLAVPDGAAPGRKGIRSQPREWTGFNEVICEGVLPLETIWKIEEIFDGVFQQANESRLDLAGNLPEGQRQAIRDTYHSTPVADEFPELAGAVEMLPPGPGPAPKPRRRTAPAQ